MGFERDNIQRMSGYSSGEQPEDPLTIKLNTNENPYPPSPAVDRTIGEFSAAAFRRYPPPTASRFREAAARLHGVEPGNILATRGGDELLRLVVTTFVEPGQRIGMTDPTYSLYPVLAQIQDCPVIKSPLNSNWLPGEDFVRHMNEQQVKLTFLVNPHAPSGSLLPVDRLTRIAEELDSILLLDEAYVDFIDTDYASIDLIRHHDNVIILRTLSKGYSLAGLRFGYGIGPRSLIDPMLTKTRDSYNLDTLSQLIATAAIGDQDYARSTWASVVRDRSTLAEGLSKLGLASLPSQANFLLVTVPGELPYNAADLYQKLKESHILVRYFNQPGLEDKLRITVGSGEENQQLLDTLADLLG